MGNRVVKNDRNSLQEVSYVEDDRSTSTNSTLRIDLNSSEFDFSLEDAVSVTGDSPTISMTENETGSTNDTNDNDLTSTYRLSSCTDELKTMGSVEPAKVSQIENQVSQARVESVVFSDVSPVPLSQALDVEGESEEDVFYSLTDFDIPLHEVTNEKVVSNLVVQRRNENLKDLKPENRTLKMCGASKSCVFFVRNSRSQISHICKSSILNVSEFAEFDNDATNDLLNRVSFVLESYHRHSNSGAVELSQFSFTRMLNLRALFPAVFQFNVQNVILSHNELAHRLEEGIVEDFLADRYTYVDALNDVVFELTDHGRELSYLVRVTREEMLTFYKPAHLLLKKLILSDDQDKDNYRKYEQIAVVTPYRRLRNDQEDNTSDFAGCVSQRKHVKLNAMNCGENVSEAGPTTAANMDNLNNIPLLNDSRDLEFISKIGGTGLVAENLRKQSLYVKFDPLVANEINNASINGDTTLTNDISNLSLNETIVDSNCRQVNDDRYNSSTEVTDSNEPVGKLISVTPNKSPRKKKSKIDTSNEQSQREQSSTPKSSPRFPDTDPDDLNELKSLLLKQMKREEAFKEEIDLVRKEHEQTQLKLQNVEKEKSQLRSALELSQENEKKLKNELKERIKSKQQLSMVMEEYEKTISQMVTRRDEEKREFEAAVRKVETERDSAIQHLNNLENAFNDVHQKYERGKIVNDALKKNEDMLKKSLSEYEVTVKTVENKYELLKSHATSQLEKANQELELITQTYEKEQAKLKAMLRKSEIQINSLQNALDQKAKENQELTAVCDELIVKLSSHSNS